MKLQKLGTRNNKRNMVVGSRKQNLFYVVYYSTIKFGIYNIYILEIQSHKREIQIEICYGKNSKEKICAIASLNHPNFM